MPVTGAVAGNKTGEVAYFAMGSAPAGWIKCNGAAVSRTTYAALFLAVGTTYGAGDGATTFNLPDLRGEFVRGLDDGRGVDSGRVIGSAQADIMKGHTHGAGTLSTSSSGSHAHNTRNSSGGSGGGSYAAAGVDNVLPNTALTSSNGDHSHTVNGNTGGIDGGSGSETRPRNVALLACIKF